MNKEIRDYQESMFWGLSFRQCLFSVLAILAALGIYFVTRKYAGEQVTGWLCVLGAAPFAACGFFRYHGMTAEQFAWAVIKSELLYPKRLVFKSENLYFSCMEESLRLGEKMMGNGAELLVKKRTKQKKPSWQMFVRLTGAPRPRVIAAAESSSPIFTEQVIIGISLYSNIFEDFFPPSLIPRIFIASLIASDS